MELSKGIIKPNQLEVLDLRWVNRDDRLSIEIMKYRQSHYGKIPKAIKISEALASELLICSQLRESKLKIEQSDFSDLTFESVPLLVHVEPSSVPSL